MVLGLYVGELEELDAKLWRGAAQGRIRGEGKPSPAWASLPPEDAVLLASSGGAAAYVAVAIAQDAKLERDGYHLKFTELERLPVPIVVAAGTKTRNDLFGKLKALSPQAVYQLPPNAVDLLRKEPIPIAQDASPDAVSTERDSQEAPPSYHRIWCDGEEKGDSLVLLLPLGTDSRLDRSGRRPWLLKAVVADCDYLGELEAAKTGPAIIKWHGSDYEDSDTNAADVALKPGSVVVIVDHDGGDDHERRFIVRG